MSGLKPIWICPKCGARLVTKNLWHSCGKFTLETLFERCTAEALDIARRAVEMMESLGDTQVLPQKTRVVCVARVRFGGFTPRKHGIQVNFALHRWLESPRIVKTTDYGLRWRAHSVTIESLDDLDGELRAWLQESHDVVGMQSDLDNGEL